MRSLLFSMISISLLNFCGKSSSDDQATTTNLTATNTVVSAASIAGTDEVAEAITDDSSSTTALNLADGTDITRTRACTKGSDGKVTVKLTFSGNGTRSITRAKTTVTRTHSAKGDETRVWTPPTGQTIDCTAAAGFVNVKWRTDAQVDGLKLDVTANRNRAFSLTMTNSRKNTSVTIADDTSVTGTRAVTFSKATSSDATVIARTKSITSSVTRTRAYTDKDGNTGSLTLTTATKTDAPLNVTILRSATDYSLQKKTVNSGTLVVSNTDGSRAELAMSSVVYDFSSTNSYKCRPTSGTIKGSVFETKDATTAKKTFVITFSSSTPTIAYDGGTAEDMDDFNDTGCDLETES